MSLTTQFVCDREDEAFVLDNHFDVAVPVFFREIDGEVLYVECYPQIEMLVRHHVEEYREELFSDGSLHALHSVLKPYLDKWGYQDDCHRMRRYEIYRASAAQSASPAPVLQGTRRLTEADGEKNRTSQDIAYAVRSGSTVFGYEENGEICSIAATHLDENEGKAYAEVMVETIPKARKRGLALSCLSALKSELAMRGQGIEYRCSVTNTASRRTARRAGLTLVGRCYYYVLRYAGGK